MSYTDIAKAQLRVDEAVRSKLYKDSVGKWSIGVGRNLDDVGLRADEIDYLLDNDVRVAEGDARVLFSNFDTLTDNRKAALVNMAFNLGRERLAQFHMLRQAVLAEDFNKAADEMLDSAWAKQVGLRAARLSKMMREG